MSLPPPDLPTDTRDHALARITTALSILRTDDRVMGELVARQVHPDLDSGELDLLSWVVAKAPVTREDLAEMMLVPLVAVNEGVSELERLDLVRLSSADDAGRTHVTPRPVATKLVRQMREVYAAMMRVALARWSQPDALQLAELLDRLVTSIDGIEPEELEQVVLASLPAAESV